MSGALSNARPASSVLGGRLPVSETWQRPADWLPMPTITPGEQKHCMLFAVWNGNNYVRLAPTGTAYTVDWGDGTTENVASGVAVDHNFAWSSYSGSTLTSLGYRQAMVTITPQGAGQFLTFPLTDAKHPSAAAGTTTGLLDYEWSSPTCAIPVLDHGSSPAQTHRHLQHTKAWSACLTQSYNNWWRSLPALQSIEGLELTTITSATGMFSSCSALLVGPALSLGACTSTSSMFWGCSRLVSTPTYDLGSTTTCASMYANCIALRSVGPMNTGNSVAFNTIFDACGRLTSLPALDTTKATGMIAAFRGCSSLVTFPTLNTPANLNLAQTFSGCTSMVTAPAMDTSKVVDMSSAFQTCSALTSVPSYVTSKVTNMTSTFSGCSSLAAAPAFADTSKVTTMNSMFSNCTALQNAPAYNLTACTVTSTMFSGCLALVSCTALTNTSAIASATQMFNSCSVQNVTLNLTGVTSAANLFQTTSNLRSVVLTGMRYGFTVASNLLQASDLDALYTSLGTAVGAQTVTVTSNPGTSGDTASIAIAKGWTVAGS